MKATQVAALLRVAQDDLHKHAIGYRSQDNVVSNVLLALAVTFMEMKKAALQMAVDEANQQPSPPIVISNRNAIINECISELLKGGHRGGSIETLRSMKE